MGIPTGPQQGKRPSGGGLPSGRPPGGQQSGQSPAQPPRRRAPEGAQPQAPRAPQQRSSASAQRPPAQGAAPQRRPSAASTPTPRQPERTRQQPPARAPQRPAPVEEDFNDPFSFGDDQDDLFSDIPKGDGYGEDRYRDEELSFEDQDDDPFESVDSSSSSYTDTDEDELYDEEPEQPAPRKPKRDQPSAKPRRLQGNSRPPSKATQKKDDYEEDFVDKENLKLKPFGKNKKKAKVGDFDSRKNMEGKGKLYRAAFIAAILAVVAFGAYKTFWPVETLTATEVEEIAAVTVGETGFPTTKGEGFALSFMDSLLNIQPGPEGIAKRAAALNYFYGTGAEDAQAFDSALIAAGNINQQVIYGPVVLDSSPLTESAASYEIAMLISTNDADAPVDVNAAGAAESLSASMRWISFNVNVYYNVETDSFAIAPNSPTLLPAPAVEAPSALPLGEPLGAAYDDYPESVNATVVGFVSGYRESSKTNYDKILQYIGTDADEALRTGLGSRYDFATPDDPASSIDIAVFQPGEDTSELKVALVVDWSIKTGENSSVTFPSHYVLTLQNTGSTDYTVTKFAPYYWMEAFEPVE